MTCGCKPVGFGDSSPPLGQMKCFTTTGYQVMPAGFVPPLGATCYISDGQGNEYPYQFSQPVWDQLPTVNVSAAAFNNLFKNFDEAASKAWRQSSLQGNGLNAQSVGITLNNMALKIAGGTHPIQVWQFTGPASQAASINSLTGMAWALSKGYLVITKPAAVLLQSNDIASGIIPPSFWMEYGKPIVIMAAAVGGAALLEGAAAGGSAASGSALSTTSVMPAAPVLSSAAPVAIGSAAPISGLSALAPLSAAGAGAAGISTLASTVSTVAGVGSGVLKGAGLLTQLNALSKSPGGASPLQPSSASAKPASLSSLGWLALAAAGLGIGLLAHFT